MAGTRIFFLFFPAPCLCPPHRDESSSSWAALRRIRLPVATFAGLLPAPGRAFAPSSRFFTLCLSLGGCWQRSRGGREPRGRRCRCAGACSRNFWLARAEGVCSPPGPRPNGVAGRLPALALIAASLRFEVTRSFQSFISTSIRARSGSGPAAPPCPRPPFPREPQSRDSASPRRSIPAEQPRVAAGDTPASGGHRHPCGSPLFLKMSLGGPGTSPRQKIQPKASVPRACAKAQLLAG